MFYRWQYETESVRRQEFEAAACYFLNNPHEKKFARSRIPDRLPRYSYVKRTDGVILAIAHGEGSLLGEGSGGRVKLAIDIMGHLYALKIFSEDTIYQEREIEIARDVRLLVGDKIHRNRIPSQKNPTKEKFYSSLRYVGGSLHDLIRSDDLSFEDKISIARKICWEVHQLHSGALSNKGQAYVHRDLKTENICIDQRTKSVCLVDYGLSQPLQEDTLIQLDDDVSRLQSLFYAQLSHNHYMTGGCLFSDAEFLKLSQMTQDLLSLDSTTFSNVEDYMDLTMLMTLVLVSQEFNIDETALVSVLGGFAQEFCEKIAFGELNNMEAIGDFLDKHIVSP